MTDNKSHPTSILTFFCPLNGHENMAPDAGNNLQSLPLPH